MTYGTIANLFNMEILDDSGKTAAYSTPAPTEFAYKDEPEETEYYENEEMYVAADNLINEYAYALCSAVNEGDFSLVSSTLLKDSNLYNSQKKLVSDLYSKGTKESMKSLRITNTEIIDSTTLYIYTEETATITHSSGQSETKSYKWKYTAKKSNGILYLSDIKSNT